MEKRSQPGGRDRPTENELDLLLSRGVLRGSAAERVRESVLDQSAKASPQGRGRLRISATLALGAATALLLLLRPESESRIRPKGAPAAAVVPLTAALTCAGARPSACPTGSRVSIAITGAGPGGYLGAFAEPASGGERVWYFSAEDGVAALGDSTGETRLPSRSIVLGPEHPPGRYQVQVVLSGRPLERQRDPGPANRRGPVARGAHTRSGDAGRLGTSELDP